MTTIPAPPTPEAVLAAARAMEIFARTISDLTDDIDDIPLWATVDLVAAAAHCRTAARLLDRAAKQIDGTETVR